jgi:large subunit ribosomal protein L9
VKVVLRQDVDHLGRKGDLLDVADGYARNFLVPRGLAMKATKGVVTQADTMRRSRQARDTREREAAEAVAAQLEGRPLTVTARAGEGGKLFGSVTSSDLADALRAHGGVDIDRRDIELDEPIKELGATDVPVRLHPDVTGTLHVEVVAG